MTTKPSCRDIELLTLAGEDRELSAAERSLIEDHLRGCGRCRAFIADRRVVREESAALRWPAPPDALVRGTRRLIIESASAVRPAALPAWVLVALAVTAIATGIWLTASLAGVTPEMTLADLPVTGLAAVLVIVQNAHMLLFAPVLLRKVRARREAAAGA
jgi:hypothetical protein